MTSLPDDEFIIIDSDLRPGVSKRSGHAGKVGQNIQFGNNRSRVADSGGFGSNSSTDLLEEAFFNFENAFFGSENLLFVFLELRSRISLGANESLLPVVVGGNQMPVGIRDLDVVAKHAIESNLQGRDSRPFTLADFQRCEITLAALRKNAQFIQRSRRTHRESRRHPSWWAEDRRRWTR